MVQVERHLIVRDILHAGNELVALLVLHGQHGIHLHVLVVELAVNLEHAALQFHHPLVEEFPVGILLVDGEVELSACGQPFHLFFELVERNAEAADEGEGILLRSNFGKFAFTVLFGVELVGHGYEFVLLFVHSCTYFLIISFGWQR